MVTSMCDSSASPRKSRFFNSQVAITSASLASPPVHSDTPKCTSSVACDTAVSPKQAEHERSTSDFCQRSVKQEIKQEKKCVRFRIWGNHTKPRSPIKIEDSSLSKEQLDESKNTRVQGNLGSKMRQVKIEAESWEELVRRLSERRMAKTCPGHDAVSRATKKVKRRARTTKKPAVGRDCRSVANTAQISAAQPQDAAINTAVVIAAERKACSSESSFESIFADFCNTSAKTRGRHFQRTEAAEKLLEACISADIPSATGEVALRVLSVETRRIANSCASHAKCEEIRTRLSKLQDRLHSHARIVYGLLIGHRRKRRSAVETDVSRENSCEPALSFDANKRVKQCADDGVSAAMNDAVKTESLASNVNRIPTPHGSTRFDATVPQCESNDQITPSLKLETAEKDDAGSGPAHSISSTSKADTSVQYVANYNDISKQLQGRSAHDHMDNASTPLIATTDGLTADLQNTPIPNASIVTAPDIRPKSFWRTGRVRSVQHVMDLDSSEKRIGGRRDDTKEPDDLLLNPRSQTSLLNDVDPQRTLPLSSVKSQSASADQELLQASESPHAVAKSNPLQTALEKFRTTASSEGDYEGRVKCAHELFEACAALSNPSELGEAVVKELWHELSRLMNHLSCKIYEKRDIIERVDIRKQVVEVRRRLRAHARTMYKLDFDTTTPRFVVEPTVKVNQEDAPASLEELSRRCPTYCATGHCRHLCSFLCYFREFEPCRQLQTLRRRARSHPLRPCVDGWTARLALTQQSPYWCTVIHDAAGAVCGSLEQSWQVAVNNALSAPLPGKAEKPDAEEEKQDAEALQRMYVEISRAAVSSTMRSPFGLMEDLLAHEPWQLLVACILLNKTPRILVDRVLCVVFTRWPSAEALREADHTELEIILEPLGLQRKRSAMLRRFSDEYMAAVAEVGTPLPADRVASLHGLGRYACDAYAIYVRRELVTPTDIYLGWAVEYFRAAQSEGACARSDR